MVRHADQNPFGTENVALTNGPAIAKLKSMRCLSYMVVLISVLLGPVGCGPAPEKEAPDWEKIKIGDLAAKSPDERPQAKFLSTARFDIYVMDVPADNVEKLDDLWQVLSAKPIRMNSYSAFTENTFRVRFGRIEMLKEIERLLIEAGGQEAGRTSLVVTDNEATDLPVVSMLRPSSISFVAIDLSWKKADVGPGMLALRLRTEPVPGARGVRKIVAYPVHTPAMNSTIPELNAKTRDFEFYFSSAAFAAQMGPGDLVVLGPDTYKNEQVTLGGRFFSKPGGTLFFDPTKHLPPRQRPSVRVFVAICAQMND